MFKANNRNTRTKCEICSKLTIKIPERRHWRGKMPTKFFFGNLSFIGNLIEERAKYKTDDT